MITSEGNPTFVKQLRDAAMACSNVDYRALLRTEADSIDMLIDHFVDYPTSKNLERLNGAWARATRVLENVPPEAPPAPQAGSPEPPLLAIAA